MSLIGQGNDDLVIQAFENAFLKRDPHENKFLCLIKSIILCACGDYKKGLLLIDELLADASDISSSFFYFVQAKMYMDEQDYEHALRSFEYVQTPAAAICESPELRTISLISGWRFDGLAFEIQKRQCEALLAAGCAEVSDSFNRITEFIEKENYMTDPEIASWNSEFRQRCTRELEIHGDQARKAGDYKEALKQYTAVLSLEPVSRPDFYVKRSEVLVELGSWDEALMDANRAISLDPSSPWSYERKHAALYGLHRYDEAVVALDGMLERLKCSPDPRSCALRQQGFDPVHNKTAIGAVVKQTLRDSPPVLINTETGYLCDIARRTKAFEAHPEYKDLILSPPLQAEDTRIKGAVTGYFRYSMLSHTWEGNDSEPLFHDILPRSVYDHECSPTIIKLQRFCEEARKNGYRWAWSDTCCINKRDLQVLQESLTSMYRWYHNSSLTIVYLKDVPEANLNEDALAQCLWNTRAWTLQEYFASNTIRFYTAEWRPYLPDPTAANHKDSPMIIHQMARATGVDAQLLISLRPGPDNVRQKLLLASTRNATKQEDTAYSLFGIFGVSMSTIYGEGQKALGRLLEVVLTRSGDITILDWTGKESEYNSCLPAEISVYHGALSSHDPSPIDDKMDILVSAQQTSLVHQEMAVSCLHSVVLEDPVEILLLNH